MKWTIFARLSMCIIVLLLHFALCSTVTTNNYDSVVSSSSEDSPSQTHEVISNDNIIGRSENVETLCSESKVSYVKQSMRHKWHVRGLADYIFYLEKFQAPFQLTSHIRFNSSPFNGTWNFKLLKEKNSAMELRVCYTYKSEKLTAEKIAFDIGVILGVEDDSVQLPLQISTQAVNTGHSYTRNEESLTPAESDENDRNERLVTNYEWTHIFIWTDIQIKLQALTESSALQNQDVELGFLINSYIPQEPKTINAGCDSTNKKIFNGISSDGLEQIRNTFTSKKGLPPFYEQLNSIMTDEKYADLIIKTGDEEYRVHRIIFANSSPVFATMVFNKTFDKNESLIDLGADIGADVVEEIIRYIYTGKVEDVEEISDRLIVAANKYALPNLKKFCESILIQQVRMENAFTMYSLGSEVDSPRLRRKAFNVMKENKSKIVTQSEEFRALSVHYPNLMYDLFLS